MHTHRLSRGRWLFGLLFVAPLAFLLGCQNDDITTYQAPHADSATASYVKKRILAVMFLQDGKMWVVKLMGPEKQLEPLVGDFDKLVESVKLTKDEAKPITWKVPPGWTELPGNKNRIATLKSPGADPLEVSFARPLPESPLLENVVRWRRQVGQLSPITEEQAEGFAKRSEINGVKTIRVDVLGAAMTLAKPADHPMIGLPDKPDKPLDYKVPDGWKEVPPVEFSIVSFAVESGDEMAQVTVSPLSDKAGSTLANVNRWRNQLRLAPIDAEQLKKELKDDKVGGSEAQYVKIVGDKNSLLGVIVKRDNKTWFFKMKGSKDLVEKQEATFMDFCHSVEFK